MTNPDSLSWEQILSFLKILRLSTTPDLQTIKRRYKDESKNFEDTLFFLNDLDIINIKNGHVFLSSKFKEYIAVDNDTLRSIFLNELFKEKVNILEDFQDFFNSFVPSESSYIFIPTTQERLKYSGIRNFLINIHVLEFDQHLRGYKSVGKLSDYLRRNNKKFSLSQFIVVNDNQKELGYKAEILIFQREKDIFQNEPTINNKIRHVSLENVMAGYDIASFMKLKDNRVSPIFIEVKAVSIDDWKFYWSRNEIEKAKLLKDKYFLYLLPVKNDKELDLGSLLIINNPYKNIIQSKAWEGECESMSFIRVTD